MRRSHFAAVSIGLAMLAGCNGNTNANGGSDGQPSPLPPGVVAEVWLSDYLPPSPPASIPPGPLMPAPVQPAPAPIFSTIPAYCNQPAAMIAPACQPPAPDISVKYASASLALGMDSVIEAEFAKLTAATHATLGSDLSGWRLTFGKCSTAVPYLLESETPGGGGGVICLSDYEVQNLFVQNGWQVLMVAQSRFPVVGLDPATGAFHSVGADPAVVSAVEHAGDDAYGAFISGVDYALARELVRASLTPSQPSDPATVDQLTRKLMQAGAAGASPVAYASMVYCVASRYPESTWGLGEAGDAGALITAIQAAGPAFTPHCVPAAGGQGATNIAN
jgi:hypothetical protein